MRPKKENRSRKKGVILACSLVALLAAGYCALCALAGGGAIYPNVTVGQVALGGMTCEEAEAAVAEALQAQAPTEDQGICFTLRAEDGRSARVQVPLSSVETDVPATVARAWNVGNSEAFPARGAAYLSCLLGGAEVLPVYQDSEALDAILDGMDEEVGQVAVESTWELGDTQLTLTKGEPGWRLDREAVKAEIFDYLGRGEMVSLPDGEAQFTMDLEQTLPQALDLDDVLTQVETPVQNAVFDKAGKQFQTDRVGISFDAAAAQAAYDGMDWGQTQAIDLILTQPETTLADLEPQLYQDVLGTCSTNISGTVNRVQNIKLAAQFFNGTVLLPGEEFSYNGVVGSRQASRGFLPAPAYVSGQTVQEVGGGVCQGSSTIYLAAMRANLEITERYPHGYITRYVPDGMDATVYYGAKDFRFKNDTPFPVKVQGTVSGRTLTVNILGTKSDNITVEMTNETVGTTGYSTVYKVDSSLPAGATRTDVSPYSGYTIKTYRNLYENGKLIQTKPEATSVYRSRDKVVMVSPADAYKYGISGYSAPAAAPDTSASETTTP